MLIASIIGEFSITIAHVQNKIVICYSTCKKFTFQGIKWHLSSIGPLNKQSKSCCKQSLVQSVAIVEVMQELSWTSSPNFWMEVGSCWCRLKAIREQELPCNWDTRVSVVSLFWWSSMIFCNLWLRNDFIQERALYSKIW